MFKETNSSEKIVIKITFTSNDVLPLPSPETHSTLLSKTMYEFGLLLSRLQQNITNAKPEDTVLKNSRTTLFILFINKMSF
jgi:hypothetical protein